MLKSGYFQLVGLALVVLFTGGTHAQTDFGTFPPNKYRTPENKLYWRNKMPSGDYWQQDVHYQIDAKLDTENDLITATQKLTYWNNSPDTIKVVYFHLYQNAFVKNSYYYKLQQANKSTPVLSKYEAEGKGTEVHTAKQNGKFLTMTVDNSILRINLVEPIYPGTSCVFDMTFTTYFGDGESRRRMKLFRVPERTKDGNIRMVKHYDVVLWYPRICVYDRKFRWETDQHLSREFYGDFGTYDVAFTTPNNYILDATGVMLNEKEMLPSALREQLDLKNFSNKRIGEPANQIISPDGSTKTWKFHAENVHDFALTMDPTYRIGEVQWNGIRCIALAQEENAAGWQDAADYTARVIKLYSQDFGMYEYPKMIVADARDGMEYPMLTLDGGYSPEYHGLLAHEVGHNWFYGMIGSNETYRAFLDEGFTQFLTAWALERLDENPQDINKKPRYANAYYGYLREARAGYDGTLNTHSDHFHGALGHGGGYGMVYLKTATMLYNLQYVLGDETFLNAMKFYVRRWKIAHPYPEDFRQAITDYVKTDLNWFFDQWLEKDHTIEYSVKSVRKTSNPPSITITLKRDGQMQMPIDLSVITKGGDTLNYLIPNTYFAKNEANRQILPYWYGHGVINKTYTVTIPLPSPAREAVIDPSRRLADLNLLNNGYKKQVDLRFMKPMDGLPKWDKYELNLHPALWYNGFTGLQPGLSLKGGYQREIHRFSLTGWVNSDLLTTQTPDYKPYFWEQSLLNPSPTDYQSRILTQQKIWPVFFRAEYSTPLKVLGRNSELFGNAQYRDGLEAYQAGYSIKFAKGSKNNPFFHRIYVYYKFMRRQNVSHVALISNLLRTPDLIQFDQFLLFPNLWNYRQNNATVTVGLEKNYRLEGGGGNVVIEFRSSGLGSNRQFGWLALTNKHNFAIFKKLELRLRTYLRYGEGETPLESSLYVFGASPEEMMDNDFARSRGFFANEWVRNPQGLSNLQFGGGLNVRGYAGYHPVFTDQHNNTYHQYFYRNGANTGGSYSLELEYDRLIKFRPPVLRKFLNLKAYFFTDGGILGFSNFNNVYSIRSNHKIFWDNFRANAGPGFCLNIKGYDLSPQSRAVAIRFDFPLWLNNPVAQGEEPLKFRWLVGIGRTF